jgi:two-component system OmpR family response regulator
MNNYALVIEDDMDLAEIFVTALNGAGYEVEHIPDGKLAQKKLTSGTAPHLILLDMHLPHVSGGDLLTNLIKPDARFADTTIIITTADALMGDMYQDQVDFVLIKPISFVQLRDITARLKTK